MAYRSYAEQTAHYFQRPHEGVAREPIGGPAAWRGADLAGRDDWRHVLSPEERDELRTALGKARATGKPTEALTARDFPLDALRPAIGAWREALTRGRGFQLVSGVPVEEWSEEEAGIAFWCLGLHLGIPGAQNPQGDLLGHVIDEGVAETQAHARLYRTRSDIAYHCDAADVVGLLCLRPAREGGLSRIASSVTVYDELLRERPDLVARLFEPFHLDVRNEDRSGRLRTLPIPPCRFAGGRLRTFYHSDYFRSAQRHEDVPRFTPDERALLDRYEEIASRPDVRLDMDLAAGDVQWLSNHTIVHARTGYEDPDDPARRRHLLRLWLSLD